MNPKLCILTSSKSEHVVTHADSPSVRDVFDVHRSFIVDPLADVVYTQMYGQRVVFEELEQCSAPYVVNVGGDIWSEREALGKTASLERIAGVLRRAARVVCVSKFLAGVVRKRLGTDNVMSLPGGMWGLDHNRHGVDPAAFIVKDSYSLKPGRAPLVIMSINLTVREKWRGVPKFLAATVDVVRDHGARLACFGKVKNNQERTVHWKKQYGLEFYGYTKRWANMLAGADVFVHPSMFDGFPRAVADACCAGLPALVFDCAGCPEVSENAIMVDPENAPEVATALNSLLASESLRRRVGRSMRIEAVAKTEEHRGDYAKLLLEVLNERKS